MRILLLEDDVALRELLVELLTEEGFDVLICDSYASLREALRVAWKPVVVADFWGTSHAQLSEAERAQVQDLGALVPTVLLTARSWAVTATAEELNVACILVKPVVLDDVLAQVERCLSLASDNN